MIYVSPVQSWILASFPIIGWAWASSPHLNQQPYLNIHSVHILFNERKYGCFLVIFSLCSSTCHLTYIYLFQYYCPPLLSKTGFFAVIVYYYYYYYFIETDKSEGSNRRQSWGSSYFCTRKSNPPFWVFLCNNSTKENLELN